jgi:secondary thiamine-phosphate synthase enzyme
VKLHQTTVTVTTRGAGLRDVTAEIRDAVAAVAMTTGLCTLFLRHTSASLVIQENADPAVLRDLERWMERLAPEGTEYEHDTEGPDDMPAHLRAAITATTLSIPVTNGHLALGTWQAVYLWEHRHASHRREIVVHLAGA